MLIWPVCWIYYHWYFRCDTMVISGSETLVRFVPKRAAAIVVNHDSWRKFSIVSVKSVYHKSFICCIFESRLQDLASSDLLALFWVDVLKVLQYLNKVTVEGDKKRKEIQSQVLKRIGKFMLVFFTNGNCPIIYFVLFVLR